jgi:hypothetical protein
MTSWVVFFVAFITAIDLIGFGILTMIGVAGLFAILREKGTGSVKSKRLLFRGIEFSFVSTLFGFFQIGLDYTNITLSVSFDIRPQGFSLLGAGAFTLVLGLVSFVWAIGLIFYPSRGYGLGVRLGGPLKDFVLIGVLAVYFIIIYDSLRDFFSGAYLVDFLFLPLLVAGFLGVGSWPFLFFNRVESTKTRILLWFFWSFRRRFLLG